MKADDCLPKTLGDEFTLSLAVTLNRDWSIKFDIFVISLQTLPAVLDKLIAYIVIKICHCIAIRMYVGLLWQRVNFTHRLSQLSN